MISKACTKCGAEKSLDEFSPHKAGKYGRQPRCRACCAARMRAASAAATPAQRAHKAVSTRASYERNRARANARSQEWYAANRDRAAESMRTWVAENREAQRAICHNYRARKLAAPGSISEADVAYLRASSFGRCAYCLRASDKLAIEHVVALAAGGTNELENLVMACQSCNSRKGARGVLGMVAVLERTSDATTG